MIHSVLSILSIKLDLTLYIYSQISQKLLNANEIWWNYVSIYVWKWWTFIPRLKITFCIPYLRQLVSPWKGLKENWVTYQLYSILFLCCRYKESQIMRSIWVTSWKLRILSILTMRILARQPIGPKQ